MPSLKRVCASLALLSGCWLSLASCSGSNPSQGRNAGQGRNGKPIPVRVMRVKTVEIERRVETVGTLQAFEEVTISSEAEGRVTEVLVDLGDRVRRGQTLCTIHPEEQQYAVAQQEAQLRQALDRLGLKSETDQVKDIHSVPEVRKSAADLYEAEQRYNRTRELVAQQIASRQDLDQAESRYKAALANHEYTLHQVQNLISQVAQFRAALALARKRLRDTTAEAPFPGSIKERLVHLGQYVKPQTPLYVLVNSDPLRLRADVPEKMAPWVRVGNAVEVRVEAHPDRTFTGRVSRVSPAVDEQKRTFAIEALIPNGQDLLRPGFYGKATVQTLKRDRVLSVPVAAVLYTYGTNKAFVVESGKVAARDLKLGERSGTEVEVVEGLQGEEVVAVSELDRLDNGTPIVPLEK